MTRTDFVRELWYLYELAWHNSDWDVALMFLKEIREHEDSTVAAEFEKGKDVQP